MWTRKICASFHSLTEMSPDWNRQTEMPPDQNGPDRNGSDRIGKPKNCVPEQSRTRGPIDQVKSSLS